MNRIKYVVISLLLHGLLANLSGQQAFAVGVPQEEEQPAPALGQEGQSSSETTPEPALSSDAVLDEIAGEKRIGPDQVFRRARLLFGELEIEGQVIEDVQMIAGEIRVEGQVHERVELVFGEVTVTGRVGPGGVDVKFGEVRVLGTVEGPVTVEFGEVTIVGDGVIEGDVRVEHGEAGRVDVYVGSGQLNGWIREVAGEWARSFMVFLGLMTLIGLAVMILVVALLFKGSIQKEVSLMGKENLAWDLLWGIVAVLAFVPIFVMLCVTIIGIPLAFLLLFIYPAAWLFGLLLMANYLGDWILTSLIKSQSNFLVGTILGIIVLGISMAVPIFGGLLMSLYTFVAIGLSFRLMFGYVQQRREPPVPPEAAVPA